MSSISTDHTGRQRQTVRKQLSVRSSVTKIVNTTEPILMPFGTSGPCTVSCIKRSIFGERSRSHGAEDRFGAGSAGGISTPLGQGAFLVQ